MQRFYSQGVRAWEKCPYSHAELAFSDGMAGSASFIDGGVRIKHIDFKPAHWDWVNLPDELEADARAWFERRHRKAKYDLLGQFRFVLPLVTIGNDDKNYWCTEAIAAALGLQEPWRYGPERLFRTLSELHRELQPR